MKVVNWPNGKDILVSYIASLSCHAVKKLVKFIGKVMESCSAELPCNKQ